MTANESTVDGRMVPEKEKGFCHKLRKCLREYSEVTGIHGIRYVTEKRSRCEKCVWALLLVLSLCGCLYMIYEIVEKYQNTPVVVNFATEDPPLYQIPFPAVTICPVAKYSSRSFDYSKVHRKVLMDEDVDEEEMKLYHHLSLTCDANNELFEDGNKTVGEEVYSTIHQVRLNSSLLFPLCYYNDETDCSTMLTPVLIDEGVCYSFNIFGREEIYQDHVFHYKKYYHVPNRSDNFNLETGYTSNAGHSPYPRRALMSGVNDALVIILRFNPNDTDFACSTFFQGFEVLIHNAWEVPRVSKDHFWVPLGKIAIAAMEPEMVLTSPAVRKFHADKRKCFMKDERPLQHFRYYSQTNCLLECLTNFTLESCGCVHFSMPRHPHTPICGTDSLLCMEQALKKVELESKLAGSHFCDCKPSCISLKYNVETSHSNFYFEEYFRAQNMDIVDDGYAWSVVQIYFKNEQFLTMERNELYGISDLISNFGGLLGLFTGFSLISGLEIVYFCTLRAFCNERMYGDWAG